MAYKKTNEKTFKVNENIEIECYSQGTSYGFRHVATLLKNSYETAQAKSCYYNRTWESYEYESVLNKLADNQKQPLKDELKNFIKNQEKIDEAETTKYFNRVSTIAQLADVLIESKEAKNSWKERMLKAGVNEIDFPENWNELSEEEKENRLNKVIEQCKQ